MPDEPLPDDLCELLDSCIDSVPALDALFVLHGDPSRPWELPELARAIDTTLDTAQRAVMELHRRGLATEAHTATMFRLAPMEPLAHDAFAELARACTKQRSAVVAHVARRARGPR